MLFCIVTFNLWLHYIKLLTYLLTYMAVHGVNSAYHILSTPWWSAAASAQCDSPIMHMERPQ